jgi:YD repeat-containing protein
MALQLTRTYNSQDSGLVGMFGHGWASSYDMHLTENMDGTVTIYEEDGSQVTAVPVGGDLYSLPAWADSSLIHNPDSSWVFTRLQTQTFTFDASGRLATESDPNGYLTSLRYNSADQLVAVTDPSGRSVTFAYGSNGLVSSATDPAERTVRYVYDAANDLISVTDIAGGATTFTYDSKHLLLSMTDPRGGTITNVYDANGRVSSQTDPLGQVTTFESPRRVRRLSSLRRRLLPAPGGDGSGPVRLRRV